MEQVTISIALNADGTIAAESSDPAVVELRPKWATNPLDMSCKKACRITFQAKSPSLAFAAPKAKQAIELVRGGGCCNFGAVTLSDFGAHGYATAATVENSRVSKEWFIYNLNMVILQEFGGKTLVTPIVLDPGGDNDDSTPDPPPPPPGP